MATVIILKAQNIFTTNDQHAMTTVLTTRIHKYYHIRLKIPSKQQTITNQTTFRII
jgi:hypothetical protein